jgi:tetratricopeptide (TPR) repeat protein
MPCPCPFRKRRSDCRAPGTPVPAITGFLLPPGLYWVPFILTTVSFSPLALQAEDLVPLDGTIQILPEDRPNGSREVEAKAKNDLGVGLQQQAEQGLDPVRNLERARGLFQDALELLSDQRESAVYAGVLANLGTTARLLAEQGIDRKANLLKAGSALQESAGIHQRMGNGAGVATALNGLGLTYRLLAEQDEEPAGHLRRSEEALRIAAEQWQRLGIEAGRAAALNNLALSYQVMAERGIQPEAHLLQAIEALREAVRLRKAQGLWLGYGRAQANLGTTYRMLAERGPDAPAQWESARVAYEEAWQIFQELDRPVYLIPLKEELQQVLEALVEAGVDVDRNRSRLAELRGRP